MRFLLSLVGPVEPVPRTPAEEQQHDADWSVFLEALDAAGVTWSGAELADVGTTRTVRVAADGTVGVTEGPAPGVSTALGGFFVLDVEDLDAAVGWAARCPGAEGGWQVEVRPYLR